MNPFVAKIDKQSWVVPVSCMCLVLGFMLCMAWVTQSTRTSRQNYLPADQKIRVNENVDVDAYEKMSAEVAKLQAEKTRLEKALSSHDGQSKVLNDSLQELKVFAGMTPVTGPGVVVTLRDSPKYAGTGYGSTMMISPDATIHDVDALKVCNELVAAGAEAVSVNNLRMAGNSSLRCVGNTILVNDVKISSPVVVRAIGDPVTIMGAMNMPGGVLAEIRQMDPNMVQIEAVKSQELPAFVGNTTRKFAKPPKEGK
ncbi:MAG: DUF881 domain-containing protein [Fimbriimonas sp.]|nr:DUF881 domain-containing protein [Fimbriimonas sp.]